MKYTLYIDESGDFQSERGQWIISGVLLQEKYEECEDVLKNTFHTMPNRLGLHSIKDFHLTEFRRGYGHSEAVEMAKNTLSRLDSLPFGFHFLTTINYTKTSLSNREKTYRLMLSDLLALCETTLGENETIDKLDLVVATRTIDGVRQTERSDIKADIIDNLPVAFEVDLATKGMVDLIGKHIKIHMDYANNSWGLVCADFIANLTYHNRKENEKSYFEELEEKGKYKNFESFGGFEKRKANIAERDGDYVLSLYRWLVILNKDISNENSKVSIAKVLKKLFGKKGTTGSHIAFEALIERLWRSYNKPYQYKEVSSLLTNFEQQLVLFFQANLVRDAGQYLFRLRNLILIVENHLGDTAYALKIAKKQNEALSKLAINPDHFSLILNFKSIEVEIYVNSLELEKALELSTKYSNTIDTFKEVWGLMVEEEVEDGFDQSRASIKAKMIQLRAELLNSNTDIEIASLKDRLTHKSDISRFENYKVMWLLKQNKPREAMNHYRNIVDENPSYKFNLFDIFWFVKSVNEAILNKKSLPMGILNSIIQNQIENVDLNRIGHPMDLILRELSLFEFNKGNKSKALKYIRQSKNLFDLENSNIGIWLRILIDIHEDYFRDSVKDESEYFNEIIDTSFYKMIQKDTSLSFLKKVRYYSPY